ncbi:gliding motility lipoprotein GldH [Bacteroides sedimenti]
MTNLLKKNKFALLLLLFMVTACDTNTTYHSYLNTPKDGWGKSDTLTFKAPIIDSLATYRVTIEVRNKEDYPYNELYLFVAHNTKDSTVFTSDTIKCILTDKSGKWKGTGIGSLYQTSGNKSIFVTPRRSGNLVFKVSPGMRDYTLKGISDIGIKIECKN